MRLVSYLRVSSAGQLDGYGFDVQRADIHRWAKTNGHKIVAEFTDTVTGKYDAPDRLLAGSSGFGPAWRVDGGKIVSLTA